MVTRLSGRLNKEGVEGQSDRPDKPGPGLCYSHCLLSRHTTDPQSLPSKWVVDQREMNRSRDINADDDGRYRLDGRIWEYQDLGIQSGRKCIKFLAFT